LINEELPKTIRNGETCFLKKVQTPCGSHNDPSQQLRLQKFAQNGSL
jgi:hypothetical protein